MYSTYVESTEYHDAKLILELLCSCIEQLADSASSSIVH